MSKPQKTKQKFEQEARSVVIWKTWPASILVTDILCFQMPICEMLPFQGECKEMLTSVNLQENPGFNFELSPSVCYLVLLSK